MNHNPIRSRAVIVAFISAFLAVSATVVSAQSTPEISYTVSMSKPSSHLVEVEMKLNWANLPNQAEVKMPVWTPGSYLVREYARHVQDFGVTAGSRKLDWRKTNKNTWQIDTGGAKSITVNYKVYANELTVRTNELNDEHLFFTPAALLMFPKGQISQPSTVKVVPYGNWKVATGLPKVAGQENSFRATNFDILYDSPFEVCDYAEKSFTVRGKEHRYVVCGEGRYDLDRMAADSAQIVEESAKIFGELPYENYLFILNLRGGGGLEHLNSTALQFPGWMLGTPQGYPRFLGLVAHEFFHLYNVKRIRPDALGPFDYENENYTKSLWVAEGTTSYYEGVLRLRAGQINARRFLSNHAGIIESLYGQPGRFETSLEEASFDAWIKGYRPDENSVNNQISYYSKGELVSFLLDIMIRSESNGAKSSDDVMRYLYNEFYKKGKNYSPQDYQRVCEMMAGSSLDDFFSRYVRGRDEIEYDPILNRIGLRLVASQPESDSAYLGANLSPSGDALKIRSVPVGSPAWESGLMFDDEIVAIDGYKISQQFLTGYLAGKKAGDKVTFTLFRRGVLRSVDVVLGKTPPSGYSITPVERPDETQKSLYRGLFGSELG